MDHDALAALFRRIVIAGFPMLAGCLGCPIEVSRNVPLPEVADGGDASDRADGGVLGDGGIDEAAARCRASADDCQAFCDAWVLQLGYYNEVKSCERTADGGVYAVEIKYTTPCAGRRPEGLLAAGADACCEPVGGWLAKAAHLEAASVDAFAILGAEMEAHGAPAALVRAAHAAARDERRHARTMSHLAAGRGVGAPGARVAPRPLRSLEAVARENAVEGCVRETFAALVACGQVRAARDPAIRAAMRRIAADETRHAALSWAVDAWSRARLPIAARRRVREARRQAADDQLREAAIPPAHALRVAAGLPSAHQALAMAEALHDRIW